MAITRIENFRLSERHLFSGIYGTGVVDVFIDDDYGKHCISHYGRRDIQ